MICREPLDLTGLLQPTIQVQWRSQVQIDQEEREVRVPPWAQQFADRRQMILEAAGTSTNLYNPARAATDRTNPEVAMAAIRQRNIESMRPPRALTRVLYVQQTTFYGELTRQNTFFVSGSYEEQEMILIAANYGLGNTAFTYYFWAHQDTRMGELAELWNSAEFGSVWVRSLDNLPAISAIWTFNGERIAWTSTVGDLGMVNGSRFRIFLPNPTAIRSNGLAIRAPR